MIPGRNKKRERGDGTDTAACVSPPPQLIFYPWWLRVAFVHPRAECRERWQNKVCPGISYDPWS